VGHCTLDSVLGVGSATLRRVRLPRGDAPIVFALRFLVERFLESEGVSGAFLSSSLNEVSDDNGETGLLGGDRTLVAKSKGSASS
jgi:hypothetical protein